MLRRFLSPILIAALAAPSFTVSAVFAQDGDDDTSAEQPYEPPFDPASPASIDEFIGVQDYAAMKPENTAQSAGAELFGTIQPKIDAAKAKAGDKWDPKLEEALYARIAQKVREQLLKGKEDALSQPGAESLKALLESGDLAKILQAEGVENGGHARRLLFDALQSGDTDKLKRLLEVHGKLGGGDIKDTLAAIDKLMQGGDKERKYGELLAKFVDGGEVTLGDPPAPEGDDDGETTIGEERRFPRNEEKVASLGFDGDQTYGLRGEKRVLEDGKGNLLSVQLVSVRRADGTFDDSINITNIKNPGDPQGDTFSLRGDFERLKAGVQTELGGVPVTLKLVAQPDGDFAVEVGGPGGAFHTTSVPPGPPMGLNQMYAYRAAKVYQYGRVVEIGGREYYVSPESYSAIMGEGEAAKKVGLGQFTYWPVEDMRKIFGSPEVNPETFDYKALSFEGTKYAALGLRGLRPDLSATVVRREGAQDVQIMRASAGQDAQGRWWDVSFENGQYVVRPGKPPETPGLGTPGTPDGPGPIPPEKLDPFVAGLNTQLEARIPGAPFKFAAVNGRVAFQVPDPDGGEPQLYPIPAGDHLSASFLDDGDGAKTPYFFFDSGAGTYSIMNLRNGPMRPGEGGGFQWNFAGSLRRTQGGFIVADFNGVKTLNDEGVFNRLIENRLSGVNPAFQFANQNALQDLVNAQRNAGLSFVSAHGDNRHLVVTYKDSGGAEKVYTYLKDTGDAWTAKEGAAQAGVRDDVAGPPGSIAAKLVGGMPATNPAFARAPEFDDYERIGFSESTGFNQGGAIYYRKADPESGVKADLQMLFVLKEDSAQPDIAKREAASAWAEQRVWDLRTILQGHPVSSKTEWSKGDFSGIRFRTNFQYPASVNLNSGASPGGMTFEASPENSADKGVVYLTIVPPGSTKKQLLGWVAAWGGADPAKAALPSGVSRTGS
jgi:hypothetical protein